MPSPELIQILRSKTRLSDEEIIDLTEAQGWKAVREAEKKERERKEKLRKPEICFSGFDFEEREELETQAVIKGLKVRKSVTKNLAYLVIGETPGEKKIEKAENQGVEILRIEEYEKLTTFIKKPQEKERKKRVKAKNKRLQSKPQGSETQRKRLNVDITNEIKTEILGDVRREAMRNVQVINNSPNTSIQSKRIKKENNQQKQISLNSKNSDTDTNDHGAFTARCITLIGIVVVIAIIIIAAG